MKRVLAIDLGGGSGRGIVYTYDNGTLSATEVHRFDNAPVSEGSTLRWDLPYLFREIKTALRKTEEAGLPVESLSIDTWGVDYAYIDENGAISELPYSYRDARTEGLTAHFPPLKNKDLYDLAGISLTSFNTSYQLYADAKTRDFSKVKTLLFMPNAVGYLLTGVAATEPCIASTSAFYKLGKGFLQEFTNLIGVPHRLMPTVIATGSVLGNVKAEILQELQILHPVKVILGAGHDTACAVMSVPTEDKNPLFLSSGTWSLFGAELDSPIINEASFAENYTNELGYGESIRFLKNIMGFWLLQECKKKWNETEKYTADQIAELSRTAPAFQGFIDVGDESFNAPGEMPSRISKAVQDNFGVEVTSVAGIARIMFESLALEYRFALEGLEKITGKKYPALYVVGGGSRNGFMNQMIADSLGLTIYAGPAEATAIGNALGQFITLGAVSDLSSARKLVLKTEKIASFSPSAHRSDWDAAYFRYLKLKQKQNKY